MSLLLILVVLHMIDNLLHLGHVHAALLLGQKSLRGLLNIQNSLLGNLSLGSFIKLIEIIEDLIEHPLYLLKLRLVLLTACVPIARPGLTLDLKFFNHVRLSLIQLR